MSSRGRQGQRWAKAFSHTRRNEPMSAAALGTVAVLGGTGEEGRGLAVRWSAAGLDVILGSRQASRAEGAAAEVAAISGGQVAGMANTAAAARCAIAVVSTPFSGLDETLRQCAAGLRDKLVVSAVIPLVRDESGLSIADIKEGSAAQRCAALLPESRVGAAFHTVSARLL